MEIVSEIDGGRTDDKLANCAMDLDLSTALNLISTLTVIGALIFAGLQVRAANRMRRDQAAIAVIQSAQSETWSRAANLIRSRGVDGAGDNAENMEPEVEAALFTLGLRLEAIGYMVFERLVELEAVDELIGGFTLAFWSRAEVWVKKMRVERRDPKVFEWCEWLALRIVERRAKTTSPPAYLREGWKG